MTFTLTNYRDGSELATSLTMSEAFTEAERLTREPTGINVVLVRDDADRIIGYRTRPVELEAR